MIYTLLFYIIIVIILSLEKNKYKAIRYSCITIALYLGLRYDYMYDYSGYEDYFNIVGTNSFFILSDRHMEYGWYLLNHLFQPFGFYFFVFFCSCLLAYGIYLSIVDYGKDYYPIIIILGFITTPTFAILSSAQRQFVVTAIFLISFHFLVRGNIKKWKDLVSFKLIFYYIIIYLCSFFHTSAYFLALIPLLYLIPHKSKIIVGIMSILFLLVFFAGELIMPQLLTSYVGYTKTYEYLLNVESGLSQMSLIAAYMYFFQFILIVYTYMHSDLSNDEQISIILYYIAVLLLITINYTAQVFRLSFFIYIFIYISIGIIIKKISHPNFKLLVIFIYLLWIIENALYLKNIHLGTCEEYKTIFQALTPFMSGEILP